MQSIFTIHVKEIGNFFISDKIEVKGHGTAFMQISLILVYTNENHS